PPPASTALFPYTTLFRSKQTGERQCVFHIIVWCWWQMDEKCSCCAMKDWPMILRCLSNMAWNAPIRPIMTRRAMRGGNGLRSARSEEHTSELQSRENLVC